MEIYLIRHAIAAERGEGDWSRDAERPLTEDGIRKMKEIAEGLVAAGIEYDRILTSPYVRARETARIVARALEDPPDVEETSSLASGETSIEGLAAAIGKKSKAERILLVGHEPDLGLLAGALLGLPVGRAIPFKKGGALRIDVDGVPPRGPGELVWMLPPRLARLLRA
jgi:phosphohistidine phosphatase